MNTAAMGIHRNPCIFVHGGAGNRPESRIERELDARACKNASLRGWRVLSEGGSALDAAEIAVEYMEGSPEAEYLDAGRGANLNCEGVVQLDAGIMYLSPYNRGMPLFGAVTGVERVLHPIHVARLLMEDKEKEEKFLGSRGALRYAREKGVPIHDPEDLLTEPQQQRWEERHAQEIPIDKEDHNGDTVGAVALDSRGGLAAATSTGGTFYKEVDRVGDSPIPGAGFYVDVFGAASATGWGERILAVGGLCRMAVERLTLEQVTIQEISYLLKQGLPSDEILEWIYDQRRKTQRRTPQAAATYVINFLREWREGQGGIIVIDGQGHYGYAKNTEYMTVAYMDASFTEPFLDQ